LVAAGYYDDTKPMLVAGLSIRYAAGGEVCLVTISFCSIKRNRLTSVIS
jgi:hypothetical protein